jgi:hypothetical protein
MGARGGFGCGTSGCRCFCGMASRTPTRRLLWAGIWRRPFRLPGPLLPGEGHLHIVDRLPEILRAVCPYRLPATQGWRRARRCPGWLSEAEGLLATTDLPQSADHPHLAVGGSWPLWWFVPAAGVNQGEPAEGCLGVRVWSALSASPGPRGVPAREAPVGRSARRRRVGGRLAQVGDQAVGGAQMVKRPASRKTWPWWIVARPPRIVSGP